MTANDRPAIVVIPGDLHLTEPRLPNHAAALWAVNEINDLIRPDFVQFIGDNVQDATAEQFALFNDLRGRLTVPWYALVGDHDAQKDTTATKFVECIGETYGSTSLARFRFIRLNTQEASPVGLSHKQIAWFQAEVDDAIAAGERVVLFQHNYPYQIWEDFSGPGIDSWREVVQSRRIQAILSGHTHYWQVANDGRNAIVAVRSIGDPEGGQPGYAVAIFHGEDFAIAYRTIEERGPFILITHPREVILATGSLHVVKGQDEVRVRIWSAQPAVTVSFNVDNGLWISMKESAEGLWRGPLPGDSLTKGNHKLTVRAKTKEGANEREIEFAADRTGRYTAVPTVRPIVTSTNFC
jgi:3',5'-cyclic-AMP phosphodiesterase